MADPAPIDPNKTRVDPDFGKPRVAPKLPGRVPQGASHDFARGQRNVPTEAVPQKDIPTEKIAPRGEPTPGAKTEVRSPGENAPAPPGPQKNIPTEKLAPSGRPTPGAKTEVLPSGKSGPAPRGAEPPTVRATRPPATQSPRPPVRAIKPGSPEGLERIAQKIPKEVVAEAQAAARQAGRSGLWSKLKPRLRGLVGPAALAGMAIGIIGFGIFEYATNEALRKMGPDQDLTALLPEHNRVEWISAPFARASRDESDPHWEPNVFEERVTIAAPRAGALAFGISLDGLPQEFTSDINVNDLGDGNSDWLCEPFGGYLICHSLGGYPLEKSSATVVTMQFHLPAYEMKTYLASPSGSRKVYVIIPG